MANRPRSTNEALTCTVHAGSSVLVLNPHPLGQHSSRPYTVIVGLTLESSTMSNEDIARKHVCKFADIVGPIVSC